MSATIQNSSDRSAGGVQIRARRESIPREPRHLTDDQRRAAVQSISLIQSIARGRGEVKPPEARSGLAGLLPVIDESRLNHNVLIDGGRGSGKTSVLLSVLKYWNHAAHARLGLPRDQPYVDAVERMIADLSSGEAEPPLDESRSEPAGPMGSESRPAIILPLHIIDLQPLASSTDLRMFLASSFRRAMEAVAAPPSATQPKWAPDAAPPWAAGPHANVREAWTTFRDVAAAGSNHIAARRGQLDAVTYAVELEQAESNRQAAGAFSAFIDALREAYLRSEITRWGELRPLFVLPIDDADMNPRLGAELIETVNLLSHDDVAYLLTGDTELFLLLLREHLAGGFRHSLRSVDLESDDTTNIGDLIHLRSLAHQLYDKHIPNAHRCRIDPLPGSERVRRLADCPNSLHRVGGEFEPLPSEAVSSAPRTLAYYFDLHEGSDTPEQRTGATERFTDGALPDTMRGLEDTREAIAAAARRAGEHLATRPHSSVAEIVRYFWRDRIDGSLLRGNDRRDLHDVVRLEEPDVPGAPGTSPAGPSTEKFVVQNTRLERDIIARTIVSGDFAREHRWALREILDYEFRLRDDGRARTGAAGAGGHPGGLLLPSGVGAALILATDVAADLPTGTFVGRALSPEEFDSPFVVTSIFIRREGEYFDFPWPMPDWDSFRDFHIFSKAWAEVTKRIRGWKDAETALDLLVYPFIALVASVAYDRHGTSREYPSSSRLRDAVERWEPALFEVGTEWEELTSLVDSLILQSGRAHRRDQDFRHWYFNRLLLLAAPESGLSRRAANRLYARLLKLRRDDLQRRDDPQSRDTFAETARGARVARANRARIGGGKETGVPIRAFYTDAVDTRVDELLIEIDRSFRKGVARSYRYPPHAPGKREQRTPGEREQHTPGSPAETIDTSAPAVATDS